MADSSPTLTSTSSSSLLSKDEQAFNDDKQPNVLVVHNDKIDRNHTREAFMNIGCKVTIAEGGKNAMELLGLVCPESTAIRSSNINLIVADYNMPEISGYELLKKVKESSNTRKIPVVIASYLAHHDLRKKCMDAGALEYLQKPLKLKDIKKLGIHTENKEKNEENKEEKETESAE